MKTGRGSARVWRPTGRAVDQRAEGDRCGTATGRPEPAAAGRPEPATGSPALLVVLLGITFLGTVSNNILNVPLATITRDFAVPVSQGVLVVSAFVLVLAAALPVTGWVGDRLGRRRVLAAALAIMTAGLAAAACAPDLRALVACRAVQGLAGAAIPPSVMGMLSSRFGQGHRARVMSAWAAANGAGQAVGPPLGGLIASTLGWRSIFAVLTALAVLLLLAALRVLPHPSAGAAPLHRGGAIMLTMGTALIMTAATAVPQRGVPVLADLGLAAAGAAALVAFVFASARHPSPLIRPRLIVEPRFLRSWTAAFAQMFCLSAVLVTVPLYLIGSLGRSVAVAGALVFALPATMAVLAPAAGLLCERASPRWTLRSGLLVLIAANVALGLILARHGTSLLVLAPALIAVGAGVALVQTPAAAGATQSPAAAAGAALGLFNMLRFAGSAIGAAWVALTYPRSAFLLLFAGCAVMAGAGLLASFAGTDPTWPQPDADEPGLVSAA
jgi:MFS family permease